MFDLADPRYVLELFDLVELTFDLTDEAEENVLVFADDFWLNVLLPIVGGILLVLLYSLGGLISLVFVKVIFFIVIWLTFGMAILLSAIVSIN
jgi:hypothetical protein